ncbi:hypothetical protein O2W18_05880 [Modestobacter sp. VKM Ac-2983]|uniref:hypothetical protein n=1 Tax=Modestobacter sp. VKM Ac-2983 TaxID=3004137 RepID=UPI0022AB8FD2|nr:hypothetical protein [Modestobacter sp. VKM Ac-2983]MCZ2804623.1 hypothetical protein [Modestobacter sp. VKM Ac-2983]
MTSNSLPARRNRWRSAAAGVAIAAASFTMTACGGDEEGVEDTGVVEDGGMVDEEEDE